MPAPKLPKPPVTSNTSSKTSNKSSNKLPLFSDSSSLSKTNLLKYWFQFKLLFTNPSQFYNSVKSETEYFPIVIKFVIFSAILQIIGFLFGIYNDLQEGVVMVFISFFIVILRILFSFITPFISSLLIHIGVLIFGGKQGYYNTFKPITYSMFISVAYGFVALIVIEILNLFLMPSFETITEIWPQLILGGAIGLIGMVHIFYIEIIGLGIYQQLSRIRAFFAIIIIPLAIILFMVLVGILFALMLL